MEYSVDLLQRLLQCLSIEYIHYRAKKDRQQKVSMKPEKKLKPVYNKAITKMRKDGLLVSSKFWNKNVRDFLKAAKISGNPREVIFKIKHEYNHSNYDDIQVKLVRQKKGKRAIELAEFKKGATPSDNSSSLGFNFEKLSESDKKLIGKIFCKNDKNPKKPIFIVAGSAIDSRIPGGPIFDYFVNCDNNKKFATILICIWMTLQEPGNNAIKLSELSQQRTDVNIITPNWSYSLERAGARNVINTTRAEQSTQGTTKIIELGHSHDFRRPDPNITKHVLVILGSRLQKQDFGTWFLGYVELAEIIIIVNIDDLDYRRIMYETFRKSRDINFPYWKVMCNVEDFIAAVTP